MNRDKLWHLLKQHGITQSTRPDCPPDADLKIVIQHTPVSAKALIDFICSLDGAVQQSVNKAKKTNDGLTEYTLDL